MDIATPSKATVSDPGTLYRETIPLDKGLDPAWVESLTERGHELDTGIHNFPWHNG